MYKFYINLDVDVAVDTSGIKLTGDDLVYLETTINNTSSNDVFKVPVLYERGSSSGDLWTVIGIDTLSIPAYASKKSKVYFAPTPGVLSVRVTLDPDSTMQDENRRNNSVVKNLIPKIFQATPQGFVVNGQVVQTLIFNENFEIELGDAALSNASAMFIDNLKNVEIVDQPDFSSIPGVPAYKILLMNDSVELLKPITVQLRVAADSAMVAAIQDASLFRYLKQTHKWLRSETKAGDFTWRALLPQIGDVALLKSSDSTPPEIQVAIDGQPYVLKKWAGNEPRLGIRLQDINGVDISTGGLQFELNGQTVDASEIALPDSIIDGNQIVISYNPKLLPGEQVLTVQATDCNQNVSEIEEFVLRVAGNFDIQMLGNYPNPFQKETRFAYVFNSPVDEMSLKIFTASGRLIRHIQALDIFDDPNPLSADYHEVLWDGRDAEGYEVANGVYFYTLSAKSAGKTKTLNGKLAKLI